MKIDNPPKIDIKQLKETNNDKTEHWKEISKKLKGWERRLIELRNSGAGYNEIRDLLQREFTNQKKGFKTNQQLRTLLYKGGRLNEAYNVYNEMMAEESFEQGQLILKNVYKRATMTIANLLSKSTNDDKQMTLFNNPTDTERAFGMSREFTDNLKRLTDEITPEQAKESFKYDGKTFKDKKGRSALRVIDDKQEIKTAEQFYSALARIKSGKVLQTLLALWNYGNQQGSFIFSGTRLNKVMQTVLKTKTGNFTQPQKRAFTEAIYRLRDFEIYLDQTITDTNDKGKKQKVIKRDFYKLIDLVGATYAKRNKDITDPETGRVIRAKGTADESVVIKLYGELLPKFNKGIMRGRLYSRGLLELDANKDERAVLLGFKLLTRFDQLRQGAKGKDLVSDNNLYIKLDRKTLIEWADYGQTDEVNKGVANQHLIKTLNKLVEINCLRDYEPKKLTTDDALKTTLYPSAIAIKPRTKKDLYLRGSF